MTGVDMDEVKLALARQAAAERGLANVEFRQANVNDWAEPAAYDFVYSRLLLMHLKQPEDLLRRMWEGVRAGGVLAVEDADFDGQFCHPENAGFDFFSRMLPRVVELNGGDARHGRKLYRHFLQAGIPDPQLRLAQDAGATDEGRALTTVTLQAIADAITGAGLATEAEVAAAIADLAAFAADPQTLLSGPRVFQAWARRP